MSWGLEASLELANDVALVLDLHHHWIATGEYIEHRDDRIKRVIDSWRGVRPVVHYSISREDVLVGHDPTCRPQLDTLLAQGYKKQKLRAHSDFAWNQACNEWALEHNKWADIMVEAKGKNLASQQLYEQSKLL
jgi:UV DNA damage repair endonuclease